MGHLINPVAFRLGWSASWSDSWYSDHLYYPEFLHDIFRVRLFLNYFFSLMFFEKMAVIFSHFEFFHKYNFLALRVFYYDGNLMEGVYTFQADISNLYLRRRFRRHKRRNGGLVGSRNGRFFLAIFFNFFQFSDFFKSLYLGRSLQPTIDVHKRTLRSLTRRYLWNACTEYISHIYNYTMYQRVLKQRARKAGRPFVPKRLVFGGSFPLYSELFKLHWKQRRPFRYRHRQHAFKSRGISSFPKASQRFQRNRPYRKQKPREPGVPVLRGIFNANAQRHKEQQHRLRSNAFYNKQKAQYSYYNSKGRPNKKAGVFERKGPFREPPSTIKQSDPRVNIKARGEVGGFGKVFTKESFEPKVNHKKDFNSRPRPFFAKNFRRGRFNFKRPTLKDLAKVLVKKRRRRMLKLFKITLKYCNFGSFNSLVKRLRKHFSIGLPLAAEVKTFLIFVVLFRRLWFLFRDLDWKVTKFDYLRDFFLTASFLFFYNGYSFNIFSNVLGCLLRVGGLHHAPIKVGLFLLSNDNLTAVFLAHFVGRKLAQGHRVRAVLSPVMQDLYKTSRAVTESDIVLLAMPKNENFSMSYRSGVVKAFVLKFFFIYKRLYGKFFRLQSSWLNFFFYKTLALFYDKFGKNTHLLLGASKRFMLQKHGFLFFFNFDSSFLANDLSFVFNELFFDFTNRSSLGNSLFFFLICDDLFSHGNVLFFEQSWKKLPLDSLYTITVLFFNRLVRYSYWMYSRGFLFQANSLNKLKMRKETPFKKEGLLGFKFHLRGRFSRKQKASSIWYVRGQMPLTAKSAGIDYAFRAYPLKNSLASVKVWLYKSGSRPSWVVRQFS